MRVKEATFVLLLPSGQVKHQFSDTEHWTVGSDYDNRQVFGGAPPRPIGQDARSTSTPFGVGWAGRQGLAEGRAPELGGWVGNPKTLMTARAILTGLHEHPPKVFYRTGA